MTIRMFTSSKTSRSAVALTLGITGALLAGNAFAAEFEYSGDHGPAYWGETAGWEACTAASAEARQSPVNIRSVRTDGSLQALELNLFDTEVHLVNNGHTIEQEYHNGSSLTLDGVVFDLL